MQCPNCRFENMPGVAACGRCGGSLQLTSTAIDVHPPRAGAWAKALRRVSPGRRSYQFRDLLWARIPRLGGDHYADVPEAGILVRLAVPGWAQIYCGRTALGWSLLAGFACFLLVAVVFIGT